MSAIKIVSLFLGIAVLVAIGVVIFVTLGDFRAGNELIREENERLPHTNEQFLPKTERAISDLIKVQNPKPHDVITSPITVLGEARGTWYFEATFPIVLVDWDGRIIAEGYAEAEDEWMTEEFVPFKAELTFTKPPYEGTDYGERGALILKKDNPSGLPEHDRAIEIPIRFK